MTVSVINQFIYDYDNMPTSITYNGNAVVNVYDASGSRVRKMKSSPVEDITTYVGRLYDCNSATGQCTKYIFAGAQRIAQVSNTGTYYYHTDHLGSSSVITDQSGNTVQSLYYYPYGEIHTNTGSNVTKYKFAGHEWDAEYGLIYMGARYYDPKIARFISADTIVPEPFDPQALNRYSYALNNPIVLRDLDGHWPSGGILGAIGAIGSAIGAVIGAIASAAAHAIGQIGEAVGKVAAKAAEVAKIVIDNITGKTAECYQEGKLKALKEFNLNDTEISDMEKTKQFDITKPNKDNDKAIKFLQGIEEDCGPRFFEFFGHWDSDKDVIYTSRFDNMHIRVKDHQLVFHTDHINPANDPLGHLIVDYMLPGYVIHDVTNYLCPGVPNAR